MSCRLHDMSMKSSDMNVEHQAVYTIRIERDKLKRLHEIAEGENRTLAGQIRTILEREIAAYDRRPAKRRV